MIGNVLIADFVKGVGRPSVVHIDRHIDGHRSRIISFAVKTKKEARQLAARYGAKPWGF